MVVVGGKTVHYSAVQYIAVNCTAMHLSNMQCGLKQSVEMKCSAMHCIIVHYYAVWCSVS